MNGSPHPSEISLSCLQAVTGGPWRAGRWLKQESRGPQAAPTWGLVSHVLVCGSSGAPPAPGSSRNSREVWILGVRAWWSAMACFLQDRAPSHPRGSGNTRDCPPQMRFWKVVVAIGGAPHVCSISDGLSHSPGSQQIRGFACFQLFRAHTLCIFFQQRLSSLTCLQICL